MARYALLKNTFVGQYFYSAGATIADSPGNALANGNGPGSPPDILIPALTTSPSVNTNLLAALDASAAALLGTPVRTFAQLINPGMFGITQGFSATGSGN